MQHNLLYYAFALAQPNQEHMAPHVGLHSSIKCVSVEVLYFIEVLDKEPSFVPTSKCQLYAVCIRAQKVMLQLQLVTETNHI